MNLAETKVHYLLYLLYSYKNKGGTIFIDYYYSFARLFYTLQINGFNFNETAQLNRMKISEKYGNLLKTHYDFLFNDIKLSYKFFKKRKIIIYK